MTPARAPDPPHAPATLRETPGPGLIWAVVSLLWLLHGLAYADELVSQGARGGVPFTWMTAIRHAVLESVACWTLLTMFLVETVRGVRLVRGSLLRSFATVAGAVVLVIVLRAAYVWLVNPLLDYLQTGAVTDPASFVDVLSRSFRLHAIRTILIVAVCYAGFHMQGAHEHQLRIAQLESDVARARLDTLATQLNPHFLFNTLDAITELVHVDADAADRLLMALSALLRRSLSNPGDEITVDEEAALAEQYIAIEKARLGERLSVDWAIDPECAQALVPALILQPLARSAIAQCIAQRHVGPVRIAIGRSTQSLVIEVGDGRPVDGTTRPVPRIASDALADARTRLRCLYGDNWAFTLNAGDAGTIVRVELPLRFARAFNDPDHGGAVARAGGGHA